MKKPQHNFSVSSYFSISFFLSLPFGKPNNKLFQDMADMVRNVKVNYDLVTESIETSLQTKEKWILISKHWYKFE